MNKLFLLVIMVLSVGCNDRHHLVRDHWQKENISVPESYYTLFDEVNSINGNLHGKEVKIRGRLVYEYDETAIFPINEFSDFKPIRINLTSIDSTLHFFLLKYDGALIELTGLLETISSYYDDNHYKYAVRDISYVDITKYIKVQKDIDSKTKN